MKNKLIAGAVLLVLSSAPSAHALSLTLKNSSKWEIHELYFSPSHEKEWGPDQLGEEVISPGESFKLMKISKGKYDVKFVDEDGDSCVVEDVDFTESEEFTLTDKLLLGCEANTDSDDD